VTATQLSNQEEALFEQLEEARQHQRRLTGHLNQNVSPEGAYRVQRAMIAGQKVRGHKLERIGQNWIHGPVYPHMIQSNAVKLDRFIQPRLEPELGLIVRDTLTRNATRAEIEATIWGYFLVVDIRDSVWNNHDASLPEHIADGADAGGFMISSHQLPTIPNGSITMNLNGVEVSRGQISDLGDPFESIAWLLEQLGKLEGGAMVFLGSPTTGVPAKKGALQVVTAVGTLETTLL
jgi:2-keto-4-pentenoate hydratase